MSWSIVFQLVLYLVILVGSYILKRCFWDQPVQVTGHRDSDEYTEHMNKILDDHGIETSNLGKVRDALKQSLDEVYQERDSLQRALQLNQGDLRQAQMDLDRYKAQIEISAMSAGSTTSRREDLTRCEMMVALLVSVFQHDQLKGCCASSRLGSAGTKHELATRIVLWATSVGSNAEFPSKAQLTYIAAASRRQGLSPPADALTSKAIAMSWLTANGDFQRS